MEVCHSAECRVLIWVSRLLPRGGMLREFVDAMLLDIPEDAPGHAKFNADAHTVVHSIVAVIMLFLFMGITAAANFLLGPTAFTVVGTLLVMPTAFFVSLSLLVQVAKVRGRFSGIQPILGRLSWATCVTVVAFAAVAYALLSRRVV